MSEVFNVDEKWTRFQVNVPAHSMILVKQGEDWYLSSSAGAMHISLERGTAERLAAVWMHTHEEEDWIDRHSLQFRWLRFWYRRKKRREARLQRHDTIES